MYFVIEWQRIKWLYFISFGKEISSVKFVTSLLLGCVILKQIFPNNKPTTETILKVRRTT